jgi:hypothetical protein
MLVLKFIKSDETGRHIDTSLSCETVEVIHCNDGFIITAYKTLIHKDGVEYRLSKNDNNSYRTCFVINEIGKTVDKYSV